MLSLRGGSMPTAATECYSDLWRCVSLVCARRGVASLCLLCESDSQRVGMLAVLYAFLALGTSLSFPSRPTVR